MLKSISSIRPWPRLGKIRIGIKAKSSNNKEYPKAVDYFVCPDAIRKIYGEQPKELFIMLPSNNPEDFFPQFYKMYGKTTGLVCKGDGETAICSDEKGDMSEKECLGNKCEHYLKKKCKEVAMLQFFIPDVPGLGIWQIDTSSFNSIVNINSMIELLRLGNNGKLTMIPLVLRQIEKDAKVEGKKKVIRILDIQIRESLSELMKLKAQTSPGNTQIGSADTAIDVIPTNEKQEVDPFLEEMRAETKRLTDGKEIPQLQSDKETAIFLDVIKKVKTYLTDEDILKVIGNCGYSSPDEVAPRHRVKTLEELRKVYLKKKEENNKGN